MYNKKIQLLIVSMCIMQLPCRDRIPQTDKPAVCWWWRCKYIRYTKPQRQKKGTN